MPMQSPQTSVWSNSDFHLIRLRSSDAGLVFQQQPQQPGAGVLCVDIRRPQSACLIGPERKPAAELHAPFDVLQIHFSDRWLNRSQQAPAKVRLPNAAINDSVIAQLTESLLPALEDPARASPTFVSHVAMAVGAHLLHTYGLATTAAETSTRAPRALAPWQERHAKQVMMDGFAGAINMETLAAACGMAPSHFATAFKASTGKTPTAWLTQLRIQRACDLLSNTVMPLSEVAVAIGFNDQSHFTRTFSRLMGSPPGNWRRCLR